MSKRSFWRKAFSAGLRGGFRFPGTGGGRGHGGLTWTGFLKQLPGTRYDYRREAGDLWDNSVVLALIKWQCKVYPEARQVVMRPARDGKLKPVYSHPLLNLLKKPNSWYSKSVLEAGLLLSLAVDGNAYLLKLRSAIGKVVGLHYVPHFMMTPVWPNDGSEFISEYAYTVDGTTYFLPTSEVVHLRDGIDPRNPRKGLSALGAVLREICTDNEAATFAASLLRNMGIPGVVITPKQMVPGVPALTPSQIDEFLDKWDNKFRGDGRGQPFLNSLPLDVQKASFSPEEMSVDKTRNIAVGRICAAFNLDPMVIGMPSENKTYSNYEEARSAAYESNIIPLHCIIDEQLTEQLMPDMFNVGPNDILGRDYSQIRVLQEDLNKLHKRAQDGYKAGILKRKDARRMISEEFDETLDDVYLSDVTAQIAADQQEQQDQNDAQDDGNSNA